MADGLAFSHDWTDARVRVKTIGGYSRGSFVVPDLRDITDVVVRPPVTDRALAPTSAVPRLQNDRTPGPGAHHTRDDRHHRPGNMDIGRLDCRPCDPFGSTSATPRRSDASKSGSPGAAAVKLRDVRIPDNTRLRPAPASGAFWVHHGISISQCSEADSPTGRWPALVARAGGRSLLNLGLGGQCHLDQFIARSIRDLPASAISLELGINVINADSMRERTFVSAFHGFLDTIRDGHPDTPVLIITPIVCPAAEQAPGPTVMGAGQRVHTIRRASRVRSRCPHVGPDAGAAARTRRPQTKGRG